MKYISTRGDAPALSFSEVLLAGLAPDGGLYVPEVYPTFSPQEISAFAGRPFSETAAAVIAPFAAGSLTRDDIQVMADEAYATFAHPATTPLVQTGVEDWLLELFHGPTLAFKDVAMQLLGQLFQKVLVREDRRLTIVGATSGDTGGAAIEALRGLDRVDVFILHPAGRISEVQRRLMTTVVADNIHNVAVEGTFDDCQALVKAMFANAPFREEVALGAINSINWARIVAQTVYYFTSAVAIGGPARAPAFTVPTGNFGDIFAGFVARQCGLPMTRLAVATNENDILYRALRTGQYETSGVVQTEAPSMDIQVSSNFERLLFEASGRNAYEIRRMMAGFAQSGHATIPPDQMAEIRTGFAAARADETETRAMMDMVHRQTGLLIDPHTAIGLVASQKLRESGDLSGPVVTLATAHPAKFPEAVQAATGHHPALPAPLSDLYERKERLTHLPNQQSEIEQFVRSHRHVR